MAVNRLQNLIGSFVLALSISSVISAGPIEWGEREEGWFWYKDPRLEIKKEPVAEVENHVVVSPPPEAERIEHETVGSAPLSVEWLQKKIPETIALAIDDPGEDLVNVRAFAYLQRLSFDKSQQFAENMQQVVLTDPVLDENNRFPISTFGRQTRRLRDKEEQDRRLNWLASNVGFFYFHDASCDYCIQQVPVLERLARDYGFKIAGISMDGSSLDSVVLPSYPDDGHAIKFRVQTVPAVVMVWPPDNAAIVSQSIVARDQLITRVVNVSQMQEILTDEVDRELGIDPASYVGIEEVGEDFDENDPATWINHIRREAGYAPVNTK